MAKIKNNNKKEALCKHIALNNKKGSFIHQWLDLTDPALV